MIDAAEASESVPGKVLRRIAAWRPYLRSIHVMYNPGEGRRDRYVGARIATHYEPPLEEDALEIATDMMTKTRACLAKWPATDDPPRMWRLRARLVINEDEVIRSVDFAISDDGLGGTSFVDADDEEDERTSLRAMTEAFETQIDLTLKAVGGLVKSSESVARICDAMEKMALGAAKLAANSGEGLAQVIRAQGEVDERAAEYQERAESGERMERLATKLIGPLLPQLTTLLADLAREQAAKRNGGGGAPPAVSVADKLRQLRTTSEADGSWPKLMQLMTPDEAGIIEAMLNATEEPAFMALFARLQESWAPRWDDLLPKIAEALGAHAPAFAQWAMECEAKAT